MIGIPSAFALGIFSCGKLHHTKKSHCTSILCNGSFFTPFYCALYALPMVQELSALYFAWLRK